MDGLIEAYIFTQSGSNIFIADTLLLLIGCVALLFSLALFQQAKEELNKPMTTFRAAFVLLWAVLWIGGSGLALVSRISEYSTIARIYKNHTYFIAEGTVEVLHKEAVEGHDQGDVITVDGTNFEFSHYAQSFHYHETINHGGILRDGVYARLTYYENPSAFETNPIIRVEVLETGME